MFEVATFIEVLFASHCSTTDMELGNEQQVIVIIWGRRICLINMPKPKGHRPEGAGIYQANPKCPCYK